MDKVKKRARGGSLHIFLILLCILMLLPFCWVISTSLRLPGESFKLPPSFFPTDFCYENYLDVFKKFPFAKFLLNSVIVAVSSVGLNTLVTTMAGYSFARIDFKGKNTVFMIFLAGMMIPAQATMIPVYIVMSKLGLVGSLWALILPAMINPLSIFFVRQFMMTIPDSYEEAAYIDGAGRVQIYARVILPMSKSVIVMTCLLNFLSSWNNFMGPLIYLSDWEKMTLPIGLRVLQGYMGTGSVSVVLAGVAISIIIPTVLYLCGQKYFLQGMTLSGLKS